MSIQVKRRREAASFLAAYTGAQGELLVDTTNNRVQVHDGATPGGFAAAKLSEVAGLAPVQSVAGRTGAITLGIGDVSGAAPLASPALTGAPTAPTPSAGSNNSQLATTSFVAASFVTYGFASATYATSANATLTGTPTAPTPSAGDNSTKLATTAYADRAALANFARTQVSDAAYSVLASDRTVAMVALTAARTLSLPKATAYLPGATLTVVDESGACSAANAITLAANGTDTIDGAASAAMTSAYGYLALESNGANKWTIIDAPAPVASVAGRIGAVTLGVADVAGAAPLASPALTGTPTAPTATAGANNSQLATTSFVAASFITYSYAAANYATASNATLTGTPTAPTQNAGDNSTRLATTAYADRSAALNFARTSVADANYTALATDRTVAFTALTASRTLTLPATSAYPVGVQLVVVDESGACSPALPINVARGGSDLVNGATSASLSTAFGYLAFESNGAGRWTIVDQSPFSGLTTVAQSASLAAMQFGVLEQLVTLSGASVTTSLQIPNRAIVFAVSSRTVVAVAGAPSYGVGVSGNATQFGGGLGSAAGSTNVGVIGPTAFYAATPLVVTATSGSFTGGQVRLALQYLLCSAPAN